MQTLDAIIPEITRQVLYPSSEQVARGVLNKLGILTLFKHNLFFLHDDEASSNFESANNKIRSHENRCDIEITPNYKPEDDAFNSFRSKDTEQVRQSTRQLYRDFPIFSDARDKIGLYEKGVPCSIEMNFTLRLKSLELVDTINTMLFARAMTEGAIYEYNQFTFNYGLPDTVLLALYKMFQLKDFGSNTVTFPEYLKYGSNASIGLVKNRDVVGETPDVVAAHGVVSITKTITDVLGKLTYDGSKPESEKENKVTDRYVITFSYIFEMFKPVALRLQFPIMINNTLLPKALTKITDDTDIRNLDVEKNLSVRSFNDFFKSANDEASLRHYPCVQYPSEDKWKFASHIYHAFKTDYLKRAIALMQVDVDPNTGDKSISIDITNDIFPMLDVDTVAAITDVWSDTINEEILQRSAIFGIAVFADDFIVDRTRITLTRDPYTITISDNIDVSKRYRLVITQFVNIKLIPYKYIYHMLENYEYYSDFLILNMPYLIKYEFVKIIYNSHGVDRNLVVPRNYKTPYPFKHEYSGRAMSIGEYVVETITPRRY